MDGKSACIPSESLAICLYAMHTLCYLSTMSVNALSLSMVTHECMRHRMTGSLWCTVERGPSGQHCMVICIYIVWLYACFFVCMCGCMYACMVVCMYVRIYVWLYAHGCMIVFMYAWLYV